MYKLEVNGFFCWLKSDEFNIFANKKTVRFQKYYMNIKQNTTHILCYFCETYQFWDMTRLTFSDCFYKNVVRMGDCFSSCSTNCMAVSSEKKTKKRRNPINDLHPLVESFEYPVDRHTPTSIHVDMFRYIIPEGWLCLRSMQLVCGA